MKVKIIEIFVCMLLITTIAAIPISSTYLEKTSEAEKSFSVHKLDVPSKGVCVQGQKIENAFTPITHPLTTDIQVTSSIYDELHPTVATDSMGNYLIAYEGTDGTEKDIYTRVSDDFGETWTDTGLFYLGGTDETYPSFDYSNHHYYGTFTPDPTDDQGGIHYLVIIPDLTNPNDWELWWWVWGTWYNCSERESSEIASDYYEGINPWEFGVVASVHTGIDDGTYRCPVMNYADDANEGYAWYYFWYLDDCGGAACEIDRTTDLVYAVYHWWDSSDGDYEIVYMKDDFTNMWPDGPGGILYEIESSIDNFLPTVAADDDNIMIICQSEGTVSDDVICYYSSNGGADWGISTVAGTNLNEGYPDAVSTGGLTATCSFIKESATGDIDLYITKTEDGGISWSNPTKINDIDGSVPIDYRVADVCELGITWMDVRSGNSDIYFDLLNEAPSSPEISGPENGNVGTQYSYTFTSTDPDGDKIAEYIINWGDGPDETLTGPFTQGTPATGSHVWTSEGTYTIKAKAKDIHGIEGNWREYQVTMPRNKIVNNPFLNFLQSHPNLFPLLQKLKQNLGL
jgi:hypothetical protein